ncbi:ParB/RepB/Spo0J family partition protein [Xenorhabdus hominickii]|uniref:VirB n=1 Tax=Xenorhabdus hominickii TaxID=351679 RepID=A0A1V0M4A7_XENHO|nr:ParB/RepB/Spo0J family partition protein [Xenorhabdus hominickii]ARD69697.1 Virulence regulon transcriptional activator VirB [Xenorhabdus hominickii]PHM51515.1 VirB [Xenorhabdus hominickii]
MNKSIQRIGRTMGNSPLSNMISSQEIESRTFTLSSGRKVAFTRQHIQAEHIKNKTFVDPTINGRDQSILTKESLQDILRTIHLQQFFPAIGRKIGEKIEILDGSRRRAACLLKNIGLDVLVTAEEISIKDARQLAADLQTAKEHNLRELGKRYQLMEKSGMNRKEIAKAEGISAAKVTRAFQAAAVPDEMIAFFPVVSDLTLPDYKFLLEMAEDIDRRKIQLNEILEEIRINIIETPIEEGTSDAVKDAVMSVFKSVKLSRKAQPVAKAEVITPLSVFEDKRIYARRKENTKNRTLIYEFARLDKKLQVRIEQSMQEIFAEYNNEKK